MGAKRRGLVSLVAIVRSPWEPPHQSALGRLPAGPTTRHRSRRRRRSPDRRAPVPPEPVAFDPSASMLGRDLRRGPSPAAPSYWFDRVLERPFLSNQDTYLYTRGRALYMYTHNAGTLGFAGGYAFRERPTGNNQSIFTVAISDATLTETTAERRAVSEPLVERAHRRRACGIAQRKFITARTTSPSRCSPSRTPAPRRRRGGDGQLAVATRRGLERELTGPVTARYGLTVVTPRLSGEGFAVSGTTLSRASRSSRASP